MKKITLVAIILIFINFIYSSFYLRTYATSEDTTESETEPSSSFSDSQMSIDDYKALDEGKATINGNETTISLGDSDVGSATSKVGTTLASVASIFTKIISRVTNEAGFYRTDSKSSASNTGLFTINSLIFDEYMLFNAKAYEKSTDLNPSATPNGVLAVLDNLKDIGAVLSKVVLPIAKGISVIALVFSIGCYIIKKKATDLAAWNKILVRWVLCVMLLFFFEYILIAIDKVADICMDAFWNIRVGLENDGYQSFEYTVESNLLDSMEKTGGVTSFAYSVEFVAIIILQLLFLAKYVMRTFVTIVMFIIAPLIIVIHSLKLMLEKDSDILGNLFKTYISLVFMQPFHALFYIIFFFSLSEIAINIPVLGIALIYALLRAENIVKAMFGWELGSSILSMTKSD